MINLIAACDSNNLIGKNGKLPWKIEKDWHYFLQTTKDGVLIMGRKCFEDFQNYAKSRSVIVLSRNKKASFTHAMKANSLQEALKIAERMNKIIWICGGRKVYEEAMPIAEHLYLTEIESVFEGDVFFPDWKKFFVKEISCTEEEENGIALRFRVLGK